MEEGQRVERFAVDSSKSSPSRAATTVARRGERATSAISPKKLPSPITACGALPGAGSPRITCTSPCTTTNIESPGSPSRTITSPAFTQRSASFSTTAVNTDSSSMEKSGVRCAWLKSTTASGMSSMIASSGSSSATGSGLGGGGKWRELDDGAGARCGTLRDSAATERSSG